VLKTRKQTVAAKPVWASIALGIRCRKPMSKSFAHRIGFTGLVDRATAMSKCCFAASEEFEPDGWNVFRITRELQLSSI
jgi:hypothetical protein